VSFRLLAVVGAQSGEAATVALADVAADMSRYELLGPASDPGVTGASGLAGAADAGLNAFTARRLDPCG
jgi:hypothetical protein